MHIASALASGTAVSLALIFSGVDFAPAVLWGSAVFAALLSIIMVVMEMTEMLLRTKMPPTDRS